MQAFTAEKTELLATYGADANRGLTEAQAKEAGYDVVTALVPTDDKAHYYQDASFFIAKLIADRSTR